MEIPAWARAAAGQQAHIFAGLPTVDGSWLLACETGLLRVAQPEQQSDIPDCADTDKGIRSADADNSHSGSKRDSAVALVGSGITMGPLISWDRVSRARWDVEKRCFQIWLAHAAEPVEIGIPVLYRLPSSDELVDIDVEPVGRVLRERVERALVHVVSRTLANGVQVTASVRRSVDGHLYVVTEPHRDSKTWEGHEHEVEALCRAARDGVGLPTS